jgi:hypothetical protein
VSAPERELRIGDKDREGAVAALGEHYAAGRLTKQEYDERAEVAYAARTASSLRPLFVDLPGPHPFAVAPTGAAAPGSSGSSGSSGRRARPSGPGGWAPAPPPGWSPLGGPGGGHRPAFRVPVLPFLLVLIGLAVLVGAPWLVFVGLGALLFARAHRRGAGWSGCGTRSHGG